MCVCVCVCGCVLMENAKALEIPRVHPQVYRAPSRTKPSGLDSTTRSQAPALYAVGNHMVHSAGPFIASILESYGRFLG